MFMYAIKQVNFMLQSCTVPQAVSCWTLPAEALRQIFLRVLRFCPVIIIPRMLHEHSHVSTTL
jgi:hypothetical protein